jgi:hypothetical protein
MALVQVADVVVPRIFNPYVQQISEIKSRLVESGALQMSPLLDAKLAAGGLTFDFPSFKDLADDAENIVTDAAIAYGSGDAVPGNIGTADEIAVRLFRHKSWSSSQLAATLAGADPMQAIAARVANYRQRRLQAAFIATMKGVFADNSAAPSGSEHVEDDLTYSIAGTYSAGVTTFSAEALIDAVLTMGDSLEDLTMMMMHSVPYGRLLKNNLIDFVPDSEGRLTIPTFMGRRIILDDSMPVTDNNPNVDYETWLFGEGAVQLGVGAPPIQTETDRKPEAGNGGGQEVLHHRWYWTIHPVGHKWAGSAANGGPTNAATSNNLAHAGSWQRVYTERKQIKIARLITTESA